MTTNEDWKFRADFLEQQAKYLDRKAEELKAEAERYRVLSKGARLRVVNNVIGTMRHAVACRHIQSHGQEQCDCSPTDDAKAMNGVDVLRVFKTLPPEEAIALR